MAGSRPRTPSTLPPLPPGEPLCASPSGSSPLPPLGSGRDGATASVPADSAAASPAAPSPLGAVRWRDDASPEALLRIEDFVVRLHSWGHSQRVRREVSTAEVQALDMLKQLETRPPLPTPAIAHTDSMVDWNMEVRFDDLCKPEDQPELRMWEITQRAYANLQRQEGPHAQPLWRRIGPLSARLRRVHRLVAETKLHSAPLCDVLQPLLERLQVLFSRPSLSIPFTAIDEKVHALLSEAEDVTRDLVDATADGEMAVAMDKYGEKAELLERALELVAAKYDLIHDERRHYAKREATEFDKGVWRSESEAERLLAANTIQRDKRQHDLDSLNEQARERLQQAAREEAEHDRYIADCDAELASIKAKQDVAWAAMKEQEHALRRLAEERAACVQRRIEQQERERLRQARQRAEAEFYRRHRQLLRVSLDGCNIFAEALGVCRGMGADLSTEVGRHLREFDASLYWPVDEPQKRPAAATMVDEVDDQYDEIFRDLILCLGDVIYKKDRYLHLLATQRENAEVKRELLSDRLDPESKRYYEQTVQCDALVPVVRDELAALRMRYDEARTTYSRRAGERLSVRLGVQYLAPDDEVDKRNLARRAKMVGMAAALCDPNQLALAEREAAEAGAAPAAITAAP